MKFLKFSLFVSILFLSFFWFFPAKADVVFVTKIPNEPTKLAYDCIGFDWDEENDIQYVFLTEFIKEDKNGDIIFSLEQTQKNFCYNIHLPYGGGSFSPWVKEKEKKYFYNFIILSKENLPDGFLEKTDSELIKILGSCCTYCNGCSYFVGEATDFAPVFWIKESIDIKNISLNTKIDGSFFELESYQKYKGTEFIYGIEYKDGGEKKMNEEEFYFLVKENEPTFTMNNNEPSTYYSRNQYQVFKKGVMVFIGLWLLTYLIESLVFFFFGSRHKRNYIYLLLANFISYPLACFSVYILSGSYSGFGLSDNIWFQLVFIWFFAELLVFLVEYMIMWLALCKYYPKKQIALFVFIANLITALIGLAISIFVSIFF